MLRILVVEDDEDLVRNMRSYLAVTLEEGGLQAEVVFVTCLNDAITQVTEGTPFDVISTDGSFPFTKGGIVSRTAGLDLIAQLESLGHSGLVVFYSAHDEQVRRVSRLNVCGQRVQAHDKLCDSTADWVKLCLSLVM